MGYFSICIQNINLAIIDLRSDDGRVLNLVVSKTGFYFIQKKNNRAIPINDEIIIGRGNDCKIVIKDERISSNHLKIVVRDNECFIVDLETKNGTIVNGQRIPSNEKFKLYHNDILQLGRYQFQFVDEKLTTRLGQTVEDMEKTCTNLGVSITYSKNAVQDQDYNALNFTSSGNMISNLTPRRSRVKENASVNIPNEIELMPINTKASLTQSVQTSSASQTEQLFRELHFQRKEREKRLKMKENEILKLIETKKEFLEKQNEAKEKYQELKVLEAKKIQLQNLIGVGPLPDRELLAQESKLNIEKIEGFKKNIEELASQIRNFEKEINLLEVKNTNIEKKLSAIANVKIAEDELLDLKENIKAYRYYNEYNYKELERKLNIKENEKEIIAKEIKEYDDKIAHQQKKLEIEKEAERKLQEKNLQKEIVKLQRKLDSVKKGS
ncbi:MAG: hypothetical protein A2202_04235 [Bdellovibrionales bacterium RIFOXYA1_FULL_36_14]|nr:MAG: hypothetical protein A2202_04235 [Bdellovibrionales bacterium RIFOXYA1_FULL_36_14]